MPVFILTIFLSAFLLFQVQPIIARYILPWFGGSPAVWTTCMLFFQVGLLVGYTYAHLLVSKLRAEPKIQIAVHLGLLAISLLLLPVTPSESFKPTADSDPTLGVLKLLAATVGLPYIFISASGPLLQHWFSEALPGKSPYRLYAVSNFGSLLGLLSYPFLFQPAFGLTTQTVFWSIGYGGYAVAAGVCAWLFLRKRQLAGPGAERETALARPSVRHRLLWIAFAACGSVILLAGTNQMTQDVSVTPVFWVLPLALYLITLIIAFDHPRWYRRAVWIPLAIVSVAALAALLNLEGELPVHLTIQVAIFLATIFTVCMVCHGEMVRLKPAPRFLTSFYLSVSLGGALGGVLVSLVAPAIFNGYFELHAGLVLTLILVAVNLGPKRRILSFALFAVLVVFLGRHIYLQINGSIDARRNFYGVLRVYEHYVGEPDHQKELYHGRIDHGHQFLTDPFNRIPSSYFGKHSGAGVFFRMHPSRDSHSPKPMKIGVLGLGIGTLANYAQPGDEVRFYEINPDVEILARKHFLYLEHCKGEVEVVLGDGRTELERELQRGEPQQFDVLFLDAFSGDSIPMHLLTREAFEIYEKHLKPGGHIVAQITNLHVDLSDPLRVLAADLGKEIMHIEAPPREAWEFYSRWIVIGDDRTVIDRIHAAGYATDWERKEPKPVRWTDDYSNLLEVMYW